MSPATLSLEKTDIFEEGQDGFACYRIPGVVVTASGVALAYCEARKFTCADRGEIEIHLRRSVDGCRTWEPARQIAHIGPRLPRNPHMSEEKRRKNMGGPDEQTVNNPVAIAGRDGTTHFVYCVEYMRCFTMRSDDDGLTWSKPVEITYAFDQFRSDCDWQVIATGPGHGIQLRGGRLVVPVWLADYREDAAIKRAASVILSDDAGVTWRRGEIAVLDSTECIVAELTDGRVMLSARNSHPCCRRAVTFSPDGVSGWSEPEFAEDLLEPGCMASLLSLPGTPETKKPFLLFSNPHTTDRPHRDRRDLTVQLSRDNGRTWPVRKLLQPGPSAYSDLAVLPDETILCFYECGRPEASRRHGRPWAYGCLTLVRFDLEWLLEGKD